MVWVKKNAKRESEMFMNALIQNWPRKIFFFTKNFDLRRKFVSADKIWMNVTRSILICSKYFLKKNNYSVNFLFLVIKIHFLSLTGLLLSQKGVSSFRMNRAINCPVEGNMNLFLIFSTKNLQNWWTQIISVYSIGFIVW